MKMYLSNKKTIFMGMIIALTAIFLLTPIAMALPGADINSSPTVTEGYYDEYLPSAYDYGYYNITGINGYLLRVEINFSTGADLNLYLLDEEGALLDSDEYLTSEVLTVSEVFLTTQPFIVNVTRGIVSGDIDFGLTIILEPPQSLFGDLPGFDFVFILFGLFTLLGVLVFIKYRKII